MILWLTITAVALLLAWLLLLLTRQGTEQQVARARDAAGISCNALQAGAARADLQGLLSDTPSAQHMASAQAVLDLALRDRPGMEGGFWRTGTGVIAYAFPTYDGTGIKRDAPIAEMERITSTAERARDASQLVTDLRPGLREAVVFAACPASADAAGLVAWTLMRVPLISASVVNPLIFAVSLLLGMVLVSGLWLGRMLGRWQRQTAQMQQQLVSAERLATLGRLSAGLAHEIRNPLATMRMKAETALAAPEQVRQARITGALEAVLTQTARLEALVSSLLALTQPLRVEPEALDPLALLQERRLAHLEMAQAQGTELQAVLPPAEPAPGQRWMVMLDHAQVCRALDNLLLNALAHTPRGGCVQLGCERTGTGWLRLWVADDGAGIPAEMRDTLFEPFTTARPGGTGLGLALVREIVQAHGGRVALARTSHGTRIEMDFPWHAS
ncbi:sensor histidine kinase [Delftia sp. PS-11]|uniref:sensor histidine kinase n=1 Tax=Delftia sp. PS-11 TaxID=2767222 RepID=UPI00245579B0|nr:HAMP domain-containing sensor histidine kinase [Delftia sp. PS-11]